MSQFQIPDVHTIALVGHEVTGKTSLADALLYKAKATDRRGSVDDGSSFADYDDEEKKQKYSIDSHVLHLDYQGKRVYLIDTPGKPDFAGQALAALNAVDCATIVVSATAGVQTNTRRMFHEAGKRDLSRILVLNKLDGDNIHFAELIESIRENLGKKCVLFNVPDVVGPNIAKVSCLLTEADNLKNCPIDPAAERAALTDCIVEGDEALMEKYLAEGTLTYDELMHALPKALAHGTVIPIFCVCTRKDKDVGVAEFLEAIENYAPTPEDIHPVKVIKDKEETEIDGAHNGEFVAQVFKTHNDKFVGHMSYFRVLSGKITSDAQLFNAKTNRGAKAGGMFVAQGKTNEPVHEAHAGEIVAVSKIDDLHIGDTINSHAHGLVVPRPKFPLPMFGLAVEPKSRGDEQKISGSLQKIADEDPTFHVSRDTQTKEMVITGMSQLHLDVVQRRLKSRYELEILTHEPKIPYRETITTNAVGEHRHKKQSGGRGQFAEVHLRVYHLDRNIHNQQQLEEQFANKAHFEKLRLAHYDPEHNFAFLDTVVGGTIPNQFVPACEKGCKELLERGALAGFRIQDVAVEIYFGKDHAVDSSEAAFKTAARIAFKNAVLAARPALLEPIVHIEVTVPAKYTGAILGDLNTKRARIEDQDSLPGDLTVIKGQAPLSEMARYAAQLGSITQGTGSYVMEFSHYDAVPGNVQQQIVSKAKMAHDEDE